MKDAIMFFSSFIGGLFLGFLTAIIGFFVWSLIQEGFENPKGMAIPAIILLGIFGTALVYLTLIVFQSWSLLLGATISLIYLSKSLLKSGNDSN